MDMDMDMGTCEHMGTSCGHGCMAWVHEGGYTADLAGTRPNVSERTSFLWRPAGLRVRPYGATRSETGRSGLRAVCSAVTSEVVCMLPKRPVRFGLLSVSEY